MIGMPPATAASKATTHREQRLVCRHDVLARRDRLHHQRAGDAVAADQLDDDVDVRVRDDLARIVDDLSRVAHDALGARRVEVRDHRDADATPGAALDLLLVALQHVERAAADSADAEQADLDGLDGVHSVWRFR
jgi:hypothetical protein